MLLRKNHHSLCSKILRNILHSDHEYHVNHSIYYVQKSYYAPFLPWRSCQSYVCTTVRTVTSCMPTKFLFHAIIQLEQYVETSLLCSVVVCQNIQKDKSNLAIVKKAWPNARARATIFDTHAHKNPFNRHAHNNPLNFTETICGGKPNSIWSINQFTDN